MIDFIIHKLTTWGHKRTDIVAQGVIGSYANNCAKSDSDLDLIIVSKNKNELISNQEWLELVGKPYSIQLEYYGKVTSLRVNYSFQPEIEYGVTDLSWVKSPLDPDTRKVISGGMQAYYDPLDLLHNAVVECTS